MQQSIERAIADAKTLNDLEKQLAILLNGNFSVWEDGTLLHTRARVDSINGITIYINPNEHAPPHFHVTVDGAKASLRISDGVVIGGSLSPRHEKLIKWWFQRSKPRLVQIWNNTRPSGCPIGKIERSKA